MAKKIDISKQPRMVNVTNEYDPFDLPFLEKKDGKIYNGEFDVTDAQIKLRGVADGTEELRLIDYLVHRPIPKELIQWQNIPDFHPNSLDMENWYIPMAEYCYGS